MVDTAAVRPHYSKDAIAAAATRTRYNRLVPIYDALDRLSEHLFAGSKRRKLDDRMRRRVWSLVSAGRLLEVGVGTGKNMSYYPAGAKVTAIDLSDKMLAQARVRAARDGVDVQLHEMDVQDLGFGEDCFDTAVATWVFCSVPNPVRGLLELGRVVRPEGRVVLLEHVRVDRPIVGRFMDLLNPIVVWTTGANINRNTVENVRRAGLIIEREENLTSLGKVKLIVARPAPAAGQGEVQ